MPVVPREPVARRSVRGMNLVTRPATAPVGAFGGTSAAATAGLGRQLQGFGDDMSRLAVSMAEEDNETAAKQADARMADKIRLVTMGDPNNPTEAPGYLNTRGEATLGTFGEAEAAVRAVVAEELEKADNQQLRQIINARGNARISAALDRMTGHASDQRLVVQEQSSLAREAQAFKDVSADYNNDAAMDDALGVVSAEALDRAEQQGLSDDATNALVTQRRSVIIKGAFDAALANSDVVRAQAIFSKHADKLDGATRTTMAQALSQDAQLVMAQSLAQEAWARNPGDPAGMRKFIRDAANGKQESAAISEINRMIEETRGDSRFAKSMQDARRSEQAYRRSIESAARAQANHLYTVEQRERAERIRMASEDAYNFLYEERPDGSTPTLREYRAQNPEQYDILAGAGKIDNLVVTERNIREGKIFASSSDGETLSSIKLMPYQDRAQLDESLNEMRRNMTEAEYRQAVNSVQSAKRRVEAEGRDRAVYNAGQQALRDFAPKGFDPSKSETSNKQWQLADAEMEDWITNRIEEGEYPTLPEIRTEGARIMMQVEANTRFFDGVADFDGLAAQRGEMTSEQRALVIVPREGIPPQILDGIYDVVNQDWTGVDSTSLSNEVLEELAGAVAMGDRQRFSRILSELGGKPITTIRITPE